MDIIVRNDAPTAGEPELDHGCAVCASSWHHCGAHRNLWPNLLLGGDGLWVPGRLPNAVRGSANLYLKPPLLRTGGPPAGHGCAIAATGSGAPGPVEAAALWATATIKFIQLMGDTGVMGVWVPGPTMTGQESALHAGSLTVYT